MTKKLNAILWTGDNLREMVAFFGKDSFYKKWFPTFEDYEDYVNSHNRIFKIFFRDGSHFELPVGCWVVRIPEGYAPVGYYNYVPANEREHINDEANKYAGMFIDKPWEEMSADEVARFNRIKNAYFAGYGKGRADENRAIAFNKKAANNHE